jgi:hypothetical protein
MSDHQYQRVTRTTLLNYGTAYLPDAGPLKAVPADAIVIERGELPAVTPAPHIAKSVGRARAELIAEIRQAALDRLALVEHLSARPPVDAAQVEALRGDLERSARAGEGFTGNEQQDSFYARDLARRLVEQGWSKTEMKP